MKGFVNMEQYNILNINYQNRYGKDIKLSCFSLEIKLMDNTNEYKGYWEVNIRKIKDFSLNEGDRTTFIFETDKRIRLIGEGKVQGYCLIGDNLRLG